MRGLDKVKAWMKKTVEKNGFFHGVFFALAFSSALALAVTGIEGFHTFTAGEVISAAKINENFEKVAGEIIFHGRNAGTITHILSTAAQTCMGNPCHLGYLVFDEVVSGAANYLSVTDPSTAANSFTSGTPINYIKIPVSGFYEIRLVTTPSLVTFEVGSPSTSASVDHSVDIHVFKEANAATALVMSNSSSQVDFGGSMEMGQLSNSINMYGYDSSADGALQPGEINTNTREYGGTFSKYFTQGDTVVVYVRTVINSQSSGTTGVVFAPGGIDLIVKRLP